MKKRLLSGIRYLCYHGYFNWLPDKQYIKLLYYGTFGKMINLNNPQNFNEKLQWLKLNAMKPEYSDLVDKVEAKKFVADKIGKQYIIPTLGVWDKFEDIDFEKLPNRFVLKTTHDSGSVVICKDKMKLDLIETKRIISESLKRNYYYVCREPQYKNIKPRIIAEEYIQSTTDEDLNDYKMICFNGEFDCAMICEGRHSDRGVRFYHFDKDWNFLPYVYYDDLDNTNFDDFRPKNYEEMIRITNILCKGFPHIRIDLYNVDGKIYFGEFTFFQSGGFDDDYTEEAKNVLGNKIALPK